MQGFLTHVETFVTAPGRLMALFAWAMPTSRLYHNDELRDERGGHWAYTLCLYYALFEIGRCGGFYTAMHNLQLALGWR